MSQPLIYKVAFTICFICKQRINKTIESEDPEILLKETGKSNAKYAFHLYDTHGLPLEKFLEIGKELEAKFNNPS